nr:transposase (putative), gypsy type [Tanacetum cinerariifolium]
MAYQKSSNERWIELISTSIKTKPSIVDDSESNSKERNKLCIVAVPECFVGENPEAYKPQKLGLGPYHHFRDEVQNGVGQSFRDMSLLVFRPFIPKRRSVKSDGRSRSACYLIGPRFALAHGPPFFVLTFHRATCTTSWEWTDQMRLSSDVSVGNLEAPTSSLFVTRTYTEFPSLVLPFYFALISPSGAGEMAPTSSKAVVFPKFDMYVYTSELTSSELKATVADYLIPTDLHPRLPPQGMTMDRLPSRYIGLYVEQLEHGGLRVSFSSFFLAVIKHSGVHVSQLVSMGVNRVILFEIHYLSLDVQPTVSLFRVFYKLYRRAIPDAMPWRHGDTDLHDDFPSNFNQDDVERLSEFLVPLRPPPRHLLYVCRLTTACRHLGLLYSIKDQDKNVISMDTFLKLTWTGTIVSKGDPIPEDQFPKLRVTPPLAEAKRAGAGQAGGSRKKRKHATVIPPEVSSGGPHVEKEVVDLSGNTRVSTPPDMANQPSPPLDHHDANENPDLTTQSHQSSHQGHELVDNRYVATPAEDEVLGTLSNVELNHDYVDLRNHRDTDLAELKRLIYGLRKANQDKDEIIKKFTMFDNAHSKCTSQEKELLDMVKELERERDEWRATASGHVEQIWHLERDLEPKTQQLIAVEEKVEMLKRVRLALSAQLSQSEADRRTEEEVARFLSETQDLDIGYRGVKVMGRKAPSTFHHALPYVQKIVDSCNLSLSELWSVHPDAPSPEGVTLGAAAESTIQHPPSTSSKTTSYIPFRTTT